MLNSSLASLVVGGVLAAAILYNGHAGLGSNVTDGTSNTISFGEVVAGGPASELILMADMGGQFRKG